MIDKAIDYGGEELRKCLYCNKITKNKICPICRRDTISLGGRGDLRLLTHGAWDKRLLKGLIDFLHEIAEMEEEKAINVLKKIGGVGGERARALIGVAKDGMSMERIEEGKLGQISGFPQSVWQKIIKSVRVRIDTDAPVTADIKRLIRLPTSLHGKSSLEVKPLRIETFREFDPVEDAVVFGDSPVEIRVVRDSSIKLKGARYKVEEGEIASVPEHAALYFICRGVAEIK